MKFRRGFKAEAERIAAQTREELKLSDTEPLELRRLAEHWGIPVHTFQELRTHGLSSENLQCLCNDDQLSGVTIFHGHRRLIFINDHHAKARQASDLAHELGHCLLEHEPQPLDNGQGKRFWNPEVEDEATWLGSALLIPKEGAFELLRKGLSMEQLARHYGVSHKYCAMRIYSGGIKAHVDRWTARQNTRASGPS